MATKAKTKPKSKPTPKKTTAVRDAERLIRDMDREEKGQPPLPAPGSAARRSRRSGGGSLRKTVVGKIPRKMRTTRALAHIVVGTAVGIGIAGRHGGRLAGRAGRAGYRKARANAKTRRWAPVPDGATPVKRRWGASVHTTCLACGHSCHSLQEMNQHYLDQHANEAAEKRADRPGGRIQHGATARTAGKIIVHPDRSANRPPAGRHRATRTAPHRVRALRLVEAYRPQIREIGETMSNTASSRQIVKGFEMALDELAAATTRPGNAAVDKLQEIMAGFEWAGAGSAEQLHALERALIKRGVPVDLTRPYFLKMREDLEDFSTQSVRLLATFTDLFGLHIAAAKQQLAAPPPEFFGAQTA